jgi:hypothetical protein
MTGENQERLIKERDAALKKEEGSLAYFIGSILDRQTSPPASAPHMEETDEEDILGKPL